jgi:hypothetical protein
MSLLPLDWLMRQRQPSRVVDNGDAGPKTLSLSLYSFGDRCRRAPLHLRLAAEQGGHLVLVTYCTEGLFRKLPANILREHAPDTEHQEKRLSGFYIYIYPHFTLHGMVHVK